jgi:dihydrofolate reductase
MRKVIVYIAASVDGYIAGPNGDMSFLDVVLAEGEDYGYFDFINSVDTVVQGRKTYDWVMEQVPEFAHEGKETYIMTRTERPRKGNVRFYTGDLGELVSNLKNGAGKNIFVDGGAEIVHQLLMKGLVDELIVSFIPVLLGGGVRLFQEGLPQQNLKLLSSKEFEKGLVQLHYQLS